MLCLSQADHFSQAAVVCCDLKVDVCKDNACTMTATFLSFITSHIGCARHCNAALHT